MTPKARRAEYHRYLREIGVPLSVAHHLSMDYDGSAPMPGHCTECHVRMDEPHATDCTVPTSPLVHDLCDYCAADMTEGERHADWCHHSEVFANGPA